MNGAIVINKEKNYTSRDAVNKLSKILNTKKIGHTGTLDPMATGVLICLIGRATKLSNILINDDKTYIASFKLGILTDTLDITGEVLKEEEYKINKKEIKKALNHFIKEYDQKVPIYSAVKIDGKKLYEYARENKEIKLPSRIVNIYNIKLLNIKNNIITVSVKVSKGTYIRSLIRDIGDYLGTYGTLTDLKRTEVGGIYKSYTLDEIKENKHEVLSIKELLKKYPKMELNPEMLFKVKNGQKLKMKIKDYILFTLNNEEYALYEKQDEETIKMSILFKTNNL